MANFYIEYDGGNRLLLTTAQGTQENETVSIANGATEYRTYLSEANVPNNADWETGGHTLNLEVVTGSSQIGFRARINRTNSSGTVQESGGWSTQETFTAGTKSISIPSTDWTAGNSTDRFQLEMEFANLQHGGVDVTFRTGTSSDYVNSSVSVVGTNYDLICDSGPYSVTGTDANLEYHPVIVSESGSYTVTGTDASLNKAYTLVATTTSYLVTGTDATLTATGSTYNLSSDSGNYTVTGTDATLGKTWSLTAEGGSHAVIGTDANLEYNRIISVESPAGADVKMAVTRVLTPTSTGTQDVTIPGFGTPKAVIVIGNNGQSDGVEAGDDKTSMGFGDGTNNYCEAGASDDAVSSTQTWRDTSSNLILITGGYSLSDIIVADSHSFITDGVRINYTKVDATPRYITVVLIGGNDVTAVAGQKEFTALQDNSDSITGLSFEPNILFTATQGAGSIDYDGVHKTTGFGIAVNNEGAIEQMCFGQGSVNNKATSDIAGAMFSNRVSAQIFSQTTTPWTAELTSFNSDGFTLTARDSDLADVISYLALDVGSAKRKIGSVDSPSATGSWPVTGVGFKPQSVLLGIGAATAYNTLYSNHATNENKGYLFGLSAFDESSEYYIGVYEQEDTSTHAVDSISDDQALNVLELGVVQYAGSFSSFDTDGFTLNIATEGDDTVRKWMYFALGEVSTGFLITGSDATLTYNQSATLNAESGSFAVTGTDATLTATGSTYNLSCDSGSYSVSGTDANIEYSRVFSSDSGNYTVTGTDATLGKTWSLTAEGGSYSVSGTDSNLEHNKKVSSEFGSYSISGQDANLEHNKVIVSQFGSYSVSGSDASFRLQTSLSAESSSYVTSGTDASLVFDSRVSSESGSYTITGGDATLTYGSETVILADTGAYTVSGTDSTLRYNRIFVADSASYAVSGTDAGLIYGSVIELTAESGAYSVVGTDANLEHNRLISSDPTSYLVTGADASLESNKRIQASGGSYAVSGTDISFDYTLSADSTAYSVSGTGAVLIYGSEIVILANGGNYVFSGTNANLEFSPVFIAEGGNYSLSGTGATLEYNPAVDADSGSYQILGTDASLKSTDEYRTVIIFDSYITDSITMDSDIVNQVILDSKIK